jgi:hypothetical protein
MAFDFASDLQHDLIKYCIRHWGKWWATPYFYNREVGERFAEIRRFDVGTVVAIVGNGGPDYQRYTKDPAA